MRLDMEGKELFWEICKQLNSLKLAVDVKKLQPQRIESVPFLLPDEIQWEGNHKDLKLQFAAVQFNGGKQEILNNRISGVTLRFYVAPFKAINIHEILEKNLKFRSELKGSSKTPYYNYIFDHPYSTTEVSNTIHHLVQEIRYKFSEIFPFYNSIPVENLPKIIKDLPRY